MSFELFWQSYPSCTRKGAKSKCAEKWKKMKYDDQSETIVAHVKYMKTTDQWKKDNGSFIPAPLVYLNQERWDGAEIPTQTININLEFKDQAILKIEADKQNAVPMPSEVKKRLEELTKSLRTSL
jgi:hypothetical protein